MVGRVLFIHDAKLARLLWPVRGGRRKLVGLVARGQHNNNNNY